NNEEAIFGCGEQFSKLNLRGNKVPIWVENASPESRKDHTYYPQPNFISSNKYYCHVETTFYSEFNFENDNFSFNPYVVRKIWETGGGMNLEFSSQNVGFNTKIEATASNYKFCPDKLNLSAGISIPLGPLKINFGYENEIVDYDGEISQEPSLNIGGKLSFE
ncbi:MAG: hypothetical protein P8X70_03610, partial [Nanoarchaeota archaeon]